MPLGKTGNTIGATVSFAIALAFGAATVWANRDALKEYDQLERDTVAKKAFADAALVPCLASLAQTDFALQQKSGADSFSFQTDRSASTVTNCVKELVEEKIKGKTLYSGQLVEMFTGLFGLTAFGFGAVFINDERHRIKESNKAIPG